MAGRTDGARGRLLFEYRPPRVHPILYAGLLLLAVVLVTGSLENLLRDRRPAVYAAYAVPLLAVAFVALATARSDVRIHENGIAPDRPLVLRWRRPFVRWDELAAVYPSFYDVTGAFVSPFASSDGKVTQMGLGLEWPDGRTETVKFTPSRFEMGRTRSRGYDGALEAVRGIYARRGEPMVPEAARYAAAEKERMLEEASRPFLPFLVIVLLFASAPVVLWGLTHPRLGVPVGPALLLSLVPPVGVSLRSYLQSRRRHTLLNRLAKSAEHERSTDHEVTAQHPTAEPQAATA